MIDKLIEYNNYSKSMMCLFLALMLIAPVIHLLGYWWQHDHLLVLIELILLGYAFPIWLMNKKLDVTLPARLYKKDGIEEYKEKIKPALILGLINGAGLGLTLILWSKFVPWAPTGITLQMPYFWSAWKDYLYWAFFIILWVLVLPAAEVAFFFMCQANVWTNTLSDFLIAGCYALMNFTWLIFVIEGWLAVGLLTAATFAIGYGLIKRRDVKGGIETMGIRVGIALGILALLIFLNISYPNVKRPVFYFRGHASNAWRERSN